MHHPTLARNLVLSAALIWAAHPALADVRLPEYSQVDAVSNEVARLSVDAANLAVQTAGVSNQVLQVDVKVDALATAIAEQPDLSIITDQLGALSAAYAQTGVADFAIVDVALNPPSATYSTPTDPAERTEILEGAYVAVSSPGYLPVPLKSPIDRLENFHKRFLVPATPGVTNTVTIAFKAGVSPTCSYHATPQTLAVTAGNLYSATLATSQMSGAGAIVEICRIQPYTSTANDNGDSWLAQRVTTAQGTTFHVGYYDHTNTFVKDAGLKVPIWTVPADAATPADCSESYAYGSSTDTDIFTTLKVLSEEKIVNVNYVGDSATITNKFVRFSPVYCKTTYENIAIPVHDANGNTVSTRNIPSVVRWFCDQKADDDYHLHSAFVRYTRTGESFAETLVPYAYVSRYPLNNASLTCGGVSYAMAKSQADGSQEVGNTRAGFLDRCRNVNHAAITVTDPATGDTLLTLAANADSRAMSMIDLPIISLIEDLAYLLLGADAQGQLRGVSDNSGYGEQANGKTDYILPFGFKLAGRSPKSSLYNFNFLDIEGGTWSAPGCMFPSYTSIMERTTTTNAEGTPTSTVRNRYIVAIDRADYNPGSADVDNLLANGYRYVSFNVGSNRRIGLDDSQVMRDAKLFTSATATKNVNYAGVDYHWQGSAPGAIGTYSATATYAENAYAIYDGKLYQCTTPVTTAEAFDSEKWTLQTDKTVISRASFMVARGHYRGYGAYLGPLCLGADPGLSNSVGGGWRSRLSFQPVPAGE